MKHFAALTGRQLLGEAATHLNALFRNLPGLNTHLQASDFSHPDGAGAIGPGADSLLRAAMIEALTAPTRSIEVLTTQQDLERLFGDMIAHVPRERLAHSLRVASSLEDSVTYVEEQAEHAPERQRILWVATPGTDADVIHRALTSCHAGVTALFRGPWPYGPTHLIEHDGPRPRTQHPVRLLSPKQAVARLHAPRS